MTDHIAIVLEQAHIEAKRRYGVGRVPVIRRIGFENGAEWLASRLTREKIAAAIFPYPEFMDAEEQKEVERVLALLTEEDHGSNT